MRLEWVTLAYMTSAIAVLALVLGQSQAMKAAWVEDVLGLLPPLAFLIALRYDRRDPTRASKVLYADAEMNRADWMTAGAAIVGIVASGRACGGPTPSPRY